MSLPKQLKLSCNQHLPAFNSLDSSQRKEDKDAHFKNESSLKIIPKKPQRHSLPAAGLLKKAASDECVEKRTCFLNEETLSETVLEGQRVRHLSAKVQSTLLSCGVPKSSLEKPIWKLPHPILPFSGSPEALKNTKSSKSNDLPCVVTKPRAKSLSSVDMDRINKPQRETQKKSSLKKFLNMKLSVCIIKSDFQRFLAKGSQSADNTAVTFSSREGCGKNWNVTCATSGKKTKPSKAHSIEKCSPPSQKGKQISRSRNEMPADQTPLSVDEQPSTLHGHLNSFSHDLTPEYENVSHYEAITDYENLSFALTEKNACFEWQNSSNIEDHDTSIYEVEEVYEATRSYSKFSRPSTEDPDDSGLMLGDLHSDEEIISRDVNSSDDEDDDDDSNSDSSKGEHDTQENNQAKAAGKKTKVYHIAKEIMSSEKVFVDVLKLLHIVSILLK
ncbi:FYVE, RhoGEF and PH domain-containing protein 6-like [Sphaerodactylus townsendi]|nr:FYVE, RhoGEF and PH domain-containing protein 6-like [Sphaerodactylus townsendi]